MEAQSESVKEISKLIGITNKKVIRQAMECLRLLKAKSSFKITNEYPRIVIVIDICATQANEQINLDKALQLINCGKIKYRNERNTILLLLGITQPPNIKSICIALGLTQIKAIETNAARILDKLTNSKSNLLGDTNHPQNACMAVYHACQFLSIKVDERKLIALSRLQRKQWTQLKMLWKPWLDDRMLTAVEAPATKKKISKSVAKCGKTNLETTSKTNLETNELRIHQQPLRVVEKVAVERYDVWKERILTKAYADLALLKKKKRRRRNKNAKK